MRKYFKEFTEHPNSLNESYLKHMISAGYYGFKMIFTGFGCIIHGILPFLFESAASDCATEINELVKNRKNHTKN